MPISPEEIEDKEFLITLRGYDKDEVKAFLTAVAVDLRELQELVRGQGNPYQALGKEVGEVLETAKETADRLRSTAREEAAALRRKTQEEAAQTRQSAEDAAKKVRDEAERHAVEARANAEREAQDKVRDAEARVQKLKTIEERIRERLDALEKVLRGAREDIDRVGDDDLDAATVDMPGEPAGGESVVPLTSVRKDNESESGQTAFDHESRSS